jgi:hypothetical protein
MQFYKEHKPLQDLKFQGDIGPVNPDTREEGVN